MSGHRSNRSEELNRLEDVSHAVVEVGRALQDLRDNCNRQADGRLDNGATACRVLIEMLAKQMQQAAVPPASVVRGMVSRDVSAIIDE